jgi:hypothetical protein
MGDSPCNTVKTEFLGVLCGFAREKTITLLYNKYHFLLILFIEIIAIHVLLTPSMAENVLPNSPVHIQMTELEAEAIGQKIWLNETGGKSEHLIAWNEGETFASLGIGHFIWYPPDQEGPFQESFPDLLKFLHDQKIGLPGWLDPASDCPWTTREEFLYGLNSSKMQDLRALLTRTVPQQVQFLIQRVEAALPKMLAALQTEEQRTHVQEQFYRLANTVQGLYVLVDYVNFKGEGISETERYQGQGWGLLQVLQHMKGNSANAVLEFADAAAFVLSRRVKNAPQKRRNIEARWLTGWEARIDKYRRDFRQEK